MMTLVRVTQKQRFSNHASMPMRFSIALRMSLVHGSAPKMPMRSEHWAGSTPCRSSSSAIDSM
jgi:hypothetical protein